MESLIFVDSNIWCYYSIGRLRSMISFLKS